MKLSNEDIYEQFHMKVLKYINGQVNDYYLAEDLCSDVFLKVYEKIDTFNQEKASLSTWIFTITRNTLIDYYRSRKVTTEIPETLASPTLDDELFSPEDLENLAYALKQLDEKKRNVIILHYYHHMKLNEIAEKLNISYVYAKVLHHNALVELKNLLSK